jgi:hypothetical protein
VATVKRKSGGKLVIVLGCLGILFTVGLYGTIFYIAFGTHGGIFDEMRGQLAKRELGDLVKSIEYYKVTKGGYPATLEELKTSLDKNSAVIIDDPTTLDFSNLGSGKAITPFFYQLTEDKSHYYLLGVGPDHKPFTNDDLLPGISDQERAKTGLLINPSSVHARN